MVSVIVPIYNSAAYLRNCIDSLCNQTYSDIEIILIDDGSQDGSGAICDEYASLDKRIRVFHKENGGVSSARNLGMREARGAYFVCVDSDDYVEPDYILELMKARLEFPQAGHIWCGFQTVTDYHKSNVRSYLSGSGLYSFFDRSQIMTLHEMWLDTSPCMRLYNTKLIRENELVMDESRSLGEDMLFNYAYLDAEPNTEIVVINKCLYNYLRVKNNSLDHKYYPDLLELYQGSSSYTLDFLRKWSVNDEQQQLFWNGAFYNYERVFRNTMRTENNSSLFAKIRYNNRILRTEQFKETYAHFTGSLHPFYRIAYGTKQYVCVMLVDWLVKIKGVFCRERRNNERN